MKSFHRLLVVSLVGSSAALSSTNYLASLSPNGSAPPPASPQSWAPSAMSSYGAPAASSAAAAAGRISPNGVESATDKTTLHHAPLSYFSIDLLEAKGPRANADRGTPHDATRKLVVLGKLASGSWWCAAGGWPSPKQRSTTEIFFVLAGRGRLTDADGTTHEFGPGDTVTLPKGWSGRWDVLQDIHKVWFVHDHTKIEHVAYPIRAVITPFDKLMAPQYLGAAGASGASSSRLIYNVGPTTVGAVTCESGSTAMNCHGAECFHVAQGILYLTNHETGSVQRCVAGDTVVLPPGWSGYRDVVEKTTMLWVSVDRE